MTHSAAISIDGLYNFYKDHGVPYNSYDFSIICDDVEITETTKANDITAQAIKTRRLPNSELETWLLDNSTSRTTTTEPSSQFQMAWIPLIKDSNPWRYQIRKSSFDLVLYNFQIEAAVGYCSTATAGLANFEVSTEEGVIQNYSIFLSDLLTVSWSYNSRNRRTRGVCLGDPWIISTSQNLLKYQTSLLSHPMALGYIVAMVLGHLVDRDLLREKRIVAEIENRTGYHGWKQSFAGIAKGDYGTLSARMSGCATSLSGLKRITKVLGQTLKFVAMPSKQEGDTLRLSTEQTQITEQIRGDPEIILTQRLEVQEIQLDFLIRRAEIQLTALFNLINQNDSKLNITLAKDSRTLASASKRDSSSMKTLAAVTVTFLPATFVASFFAMPLFNWDAQPNAAVVKERFWIYWAVTAPLTLTTLFIWLSWTHRQSLIHRAQDRRARDQVVDELNGS